MTKEGEGEAMETMSISVETNVQWQPVHPRSKYPYDEWLALLRAGKGPLKLLLTRKNRAVVIVLWFRRHCKDEIEAAIHMSAGGVFLRLKESPTEIHLENR